MTADKKIQTKAYVRAKHTLTLLATESVVNVVEYQIEQLDSVVEEHKELIEALREEKSELQSALTGYKQALKEKR